MAPKALFMSSCMVDDVDATSNQNPWTQSVHFSNARYCCLHLALLQKRASVLWESARKSDGSKCPALKTPSCRSLTTIIYGFSGNLILMKPENEWTAKPKFQTVSSIFRRSTMKYRGRHIAAFRLFKQCIAGTCFSLLFLQQFLDPDDGIKWF